MLGALSSIKNETEAAIVQRLFERGDVNATAIYHGQTALMLSTSHGKIETTKLLLKIGADVNIQDIFDSSVFGGFSIVASKIGAVNIHSSNASDSHGI
jgi:ankyrin repeat protein